MSREKDYKELEENHSYIQWLFPNYYQSAFNSDAQPLTKDEALIFINHPDVYKSIK